MIIRSKGFSVFDAIRWRATFDAYVRFINTDVFIISLRITNTSARIPTDGKNDDLVILSYKSQIKRRVIIVKKKKRTKNKIRLSRFSRNMNRRYT